MSSGKAEEGGAVVDDSDGSDEHVACQLHGVYLGSSSDEDAGSGDSDDALCASAQHAAASELPSQLDRLREHGQFKVEFARQHRARMRASGKEEEHADEVEYQHHTAPGAAKGGVVERVKAFFYEELSFSDEFNAWAATRCGVVDPDSSEVRWWRLLQLPAVLSDRMD